MGINMGKEKWLPDKEYLRDHRSEGRKWLTNIKYFWLSPKISWSLVFCIDKMCVQFQNVWA